MVSVNLCVALQQSKSVCHVFFKPVKSHYNKSNMSLLCPSKDIYWDLPMLFVQLWSLQELTQIMFPVVTGRTTLGSERTDIPLQGPGIAAQHCYIENQAGSITLYPCGNPCSVDGLAISKPYRLTQGSSGTSPRKCTQTAVLGAAVET